MVLSYMRWGLDTRIIAGSVFFSLVYIVYEQVLNDIASTSYVPIAVVVLLAYGYISYMVYRYEYRIAFTVLFLMAIISIIRITTLNDITPGQQDLFLVRSMSLVTVIGLSIFPIVALKQRGDRNTRSSIIAGIATSGFLIVMTILIRTI
jgi:hypothetical protein